MDWVYCFAYGSCMDTRSFSKTIGEKNYEVMGPAVLRHYRLAFTLFVPHRRGGVADIIPSPGEYVEGVLYRVNPKVLYLLDEREGVAQKIYKRTEIEIDYLGEKMEVMTYTVVNKAAEEVKPSLAYAKLIYNGAVQHLSFSYRKKLIWSLSRRFGMDYFVNYEREVGV